MIIAFACLAFAACSSASSDQQKLVGNWIEILPPDLPYIQGIAINPDGTARSIGMATLQYENWSIEGENLILTGKSIGNGQTIQFTDTLAITRLTDDSLSLHKADYSADYYRVADPENVR